MPKNCFNICDKSKYPDLRLITNASQNPPLTDGIIDVNSYFWKTYNERVHPLRLTQNYVTPESYASKYGWDTGVIVNKLQLQCLVENIADFGADNDWAFTESQGYKVGLSTYFDNLFEFDTYEKGKGNSWKFLYSDTKKEFFPSTRAQIEYENADFEWNYERAIQAKMGDFYYNPFRLPNHDGVYKIIVKFNPVVKGCHAVQETNYDNNQEIVIVEIKEGKVILLPNQ